MKGGISHMDRNLFYIYNFRQNSHFIKSGLIPIDCGVGKKGDPYLIFERNEESEKVFKEWANSTNKHLVCK